jgi:nucleoside phosphorylase
MIALFNDY